jgi:hypothetical protein
MQGRPPHWAGLTVILRISLDILGSPGAIDATTVAGTAGAGKTDDQTT